MNDHSSGCECTVCSDFQEMENRRVPGGGAIVWMWLAFVIGGSVAIGSFVRWMLGQ